RLGSSMITVFPSSPGPMPPVVVVTLVEYGITTMPVRPAGTSGNVGVTKRTVWNRFVIETSKLTRTLPIGAPSAPTPVAWNPLVVTRIPSPDNNDKEGWSFPAAAAGVPGGRTTTRPLANATSRMKARSGAVGGVGPTGGSGSNGSRSEVQVEAATHMI